MLTIKSVTNIKIEQLGLDENLKLQIESLLSFYKGKTPDHITTGEMTINLKTLLQWRIVLVG